MSSHHGAAKTSRTVWEGIEDLKGCLRCIYRLTGLVQKDRTNYRPPLSYS